MTRVSIIKEIALATDEAVTEALWRIAKTDPEFSGECGMYCRWERAEEFESNAAYLIDKVKDIFPFEDRIYKFCEEWLNNDHYYDAWEADISMIDESKLLIVVSWVTIIE